ncbi:MAG: AAA family ATPase [Candidatus Thalassarchaeaceae archaeon]|jgi:dCMP deaminase|nr:AAA family ATPase [Candidatus Thalassarchaeaceae archaeon]MDP7043233.1 AAA family ATPase [Candidatus Thalassarchaeaceae archaeon]
MMLVGLAGRNASGKTTVIDWLKSKGFESNSCSDSIRHWLRSNNREITRDNLIDGGRKLRAMGGPGILAEMLLDLIEEGSKHAVDSIRTPAEVEAFRKRDDFVLVEIRAPRELRWQRLLERGRTGDAETFEQFSIQEEAELVAHDESGQALIATAKMADVVIHNNGDIDDLHKQLEIFMEEYS